MVYSWHTTMNFGSALQQGHIRVSLVMIDPPHPSPPSQTQALIHRGIFIKPKSKVQNYLAAAPLLPATR